MIKANITPQHVQDFLMGEAFSDDHSHVLLACFPKSGSTYLARLIASLPCVGDFHELFMSVGGHREEHELNTVSLMLYHENSYVSQQHIRYSPNTQRCLDIFNLSPIFLVRNIFDVIVSINDHWDNENYAGPQAFVPDSLLSRPTEQRLDFIIDFIVPWYINLYMSWTECEDKFFLTYEQLKGDTFSSLSRIAEYCGIEACENDIAAAIENADNTFTRKNVGVSGRGKDSLNEQQIEKVKAYFSYYEGVDFSSIGI